MKKRFSVLATIVFISNFSFSQSLNVIGDWEGQLTPKLKLIVHIYQEDNKLLSKIDSSDQGAFGIKSNETSFTDSKLLFQINALMSKYEGTLVDSTIQGYWFQGGSKLPLNLNRKKSTIEIKPQTPKPPFEYYVEDIEYDNEDKNIHYGATLTLPKNADNYPIAILISGSGKQDRDCTLGSHKPFAVIADHLTKQGIGVLRVDDRSTGKTTGNFNNSTSYDFASDVETSLAYLKDRKDFQNKKIGLIGHSEGGIIAQIVASKNKQVDFIVFMAAPGVPTSTLMPQQSKAVMMKAGISEQASDAYSLLYKNMIDLINKDLDSKTTYESAKLLFQQWQNANAPSIVSATTQVTDSLSADIFVKKLITQFSSPWYKSFLRYDPAPQLKKIKCPVLALNGEKDIQVLAKTNLDAINKHLKEANNKQFEAQELAGLNHLFQECTACDIGEYFTLQQTISPVLLNRIAEWISKVANTDLKPRK